MRQTLFKKLIKRHAHLFRRDSVLLLYMTNTNRKYYHLQSVLHKHMNMLPTLNLHSVAKKLERFLKVLEARKKS